MKSLWRRQFANSFIEYLMFDHTTEILWYSNFTNPLNTKLYTACLNIGKAIPALKSVKGYLREIDLHYKCSTILLGVL